MSTESLTAGGNQVRSGSEFKRILVATDFSRSAKSALDYAHTLASRLRAKLFLVHVIPSRILHFVRPDSSSEAIATARQYARQELDGLIAVAGLYDISHEEILAEGQVWPVLQDIIKSQQIDLVVVGTHGRTSDQKLVLGSVAEEIFRMADCPVLTVGPQVKDLQGAKTGLQNLLYATNFKPHAERAAGTAHALVREHAAHFCMLHVVEEPNEDSVAGNPIVQDFLVKRMRKGLPQACVNRCEPEFLVRFGEPGEEILRTAKDSHSDLIVLGLRPGEKRAGYLPSAVAYRIVCQATCPVLTLRR